MDGADGRLLQASPTEGVRGAYGWRGRIGLLAPSRGDTLLHEFYTVAPVGVMAVPYSCELTHLDRSQLERVFAKYAEGIAKLAREEVDVISIGGTPGQIIHGGARCAELITELRAANDVPLVFSSESEVDIVARSGGKRIALLSPHKDELHERLVEVFTAAGTEVVSSQGMGLTDTHEIGKVTPERLYREVVQLWRTARELGADGVHITCPRWPTIGILSPLEDRLGVPVTSGAQAQIWSAFRTLHLAPRPGGWGSAFDVKRDQNDYAV